MTDEGKVPAGFYRGRAIEGSEDFGMSDKGEQLALGVEIPSLSRRFTVFMSFSDAAMKYSVEKLRACGWTGEDITNLAGVSKNEVDISVKYETWKGEERMKVDIYAGGGRVKLDNPLDERQKREFAARMKGFLKSSATPAARPANAAPPPARREGAYDPGPEPSDDIPF